MAHVPATVIVGAQWGDEGKGKIVDLLAQDSDLVCRYQGGPERRAHDRRRRRDVQDPPDPVGIVAGKASAIGAGCVVDPRVVIDELDDLEGRGHVTAGLVFLSGNAHLIMPWHVALDGARERKLGNLQIGTTRRGIGPAYADKATRIGIRVQDLLDPKILRQKIELAITEKNVWLERVYEIEPFDLEDVAHTYEGYAQTAAPVRGRHRRCSSIARSATATTCSSRAPRGRCSTSTTARIRSSPRRARSQPGRRSASASARTASTRSSAVSKAYVRRVGEGPFPSEIQGEAQERVRELGGEVRHRHGPRAPLRLARPAGPPLRRSGSTASRRSR
jgi:adenylosuccinate synthase